MATVGASYSQGVKVGFPANEYDKADFHISLKHEEDFADPPSDDADYAVWKAAYDKRRDEILNDLRDRVEAMLQEDIDKFVEENTPDEVSV